MPTPEEARLHMPSKSSSADVDLQRNFMEIERVVNEYPVFPTYRYEIMPTVGTNGSNANWTRASLTTTGFIGIYRFRKIESWTNLHCRYEGSGYGLNPTPNTKIELGFVLHLTGIQALSFVSTINDQLPGRHFFNDHSKHLPISADASMTGIPAGLYDVYLIWRFPTPTVRFDENDFHRLHVTETIPVPRSLT